MKHAKMIRLYSSSNGDIWFLGCDPASGTAFVRHKANIPSGGQVTDMPIETFLSGPRNPEHEALLSLLSALVRDTHRADTAVERAVESAGREWSGAELSELEDLLFCEISIKEIARLLGRNHDDVEDKIAKLAVRI
jgi:hypothetical protein